MTVIYLRPDRCRGYLRIGAQRGEEGRAFTVSESEYRAAGSPPVGDNLTREAVELLSAADMRYKARAKALRILSYGDNSERALYRKLTAAGIDRAAAEDAVREMVSLGYINADRQLERLIVSEVNIHLQGPRRLLARLTAKGYLRSDIERVIDGLLERGEIDFDESRERLIEKRLGKCADPEEIKKLLYRNGYEIC